MKILWRELLAREEPVAAVIHSLDQALYQVTVETSAGPQLLLAEGGRPFRCHSLQQARGVVGTSR